MRTIFRDGGNSFEDLVSGHRVVREIARGGMGIVYEAIDEKANRPVALKMMMPYVADREGMRERFRVEVKASAGLEHSAILPVYWVGESNGLPFMTMKLATGGTLADQKGRISRRLAGDCFFVGADGGCCGFCAQPWVAAS